MIATSLHTLTPTYLVTAGKGISPDSLTSCPGVLYDELLPPSLRSPAYKPDFIRLLEPRFIGQWNTERRYT
jgi:hypothetical protein